LFRGILGANPWKDYWSTTLSTGQSAGGVLADLGLEEGPRPELFHEDGPAYLVDNTPEDDPEPYPFCGPAKDRPRPNFNSYCDVLLGDFVLCRPSHNNHLPVRLGRALTCVHNIPGDNYGRFMVEWWTPMKGKREGKHALVRECWTQRWEKELTLPEVIHCSIVVFSHRLPFH
jgi:hypothetical protein